MLDVIGAINGQDDYAKTRNYWKYLKTKLKKDDNEVVSATNQLKLLAPDGKRRLTDTLDANGIIELSKAGQVPDSCLSCDFSILWEVFEFIKGASGEPCFRLLMMILIIRSRLSI